MFIWDNCLSLRPQANATVQNGSSPDFLFSSSCSVKRKKWALLTNADVCSVLVSLINVASDNVALKLNVDTNITVLHYAASYLSRNDHTIICCAIWFDVSASRAFKHVAGCPPRTWTTYVALHLPQLLSVVKMVSGDGQCSPATKVGVSIATATRTIRMLCFPLLRLQIATSVIKTNMKIK